jgi:hypothetical protein
MRLCVSHEHNSEKELIHNKMNKDELVIGIGRPVAESSMINTMKAYPSVITNMGQTSDKVLSILSDVQTGRCRRDQWKDILKEIKGRTVEKFTDLEIKQLENAHYMYFVGISVGLAYAHSSSGDTVGSVMAGGLRSFRNGPADVHSGDPLIWVSAWEAKHLFTYGAKGARFIPNGQPPEDDTWVQNGSKRKYSEMQNGNFGKKGGGKMNMFTVIPLMMDHDGTYNPYLKARIIGRAISNAAPYDMVDIQLMRQTM